MAASMSVNELLQTARQLDPKDFEDFIRKILSLRSQRSQGTLTDRERRLLEKINVQLPLRIRERFDYLIAKRDAETISPEEYEELLDLTEKMEQHDLNRLRLIAKLAEVNDISLPEVVKKFNLHPAPQG